MGQADFSRQYNISYITRYNRMRELIMSNPSISEYSLPLKKLGDDIFEECIVIAILVLDSKLKFSILQMNDPNVESYVPNSQLYIEDFSGKLPIVFSQSFNKLSLLCTGTVLGFVGCKIETNVFVCTDVIFPKPVEVPANASIRNSTDANIKSDGRPAKSTVENVLLMSNIVLNHSNFEKCKAMVDYFYKKVSSIVVFGDIYTESNREPDFSDFNNIFNELNDFKGQIVLVPGPNDPTTKMLPQNPLHQLFFDQRLSTCLRNLSHPAQETVCGKKVVFMNNQILNDLRKYTMNIVAGPQTPIVLGDADILEQLIRIRLIAPNCPDTVGSTPFFEHDPFLIDDCNYLVCGGCKEFQIKRVGKIVAVCIPDFSKSHSAVLADFSSDSFTEIVLDL
ncbi:uncharacterized protein VICG_01090 [Vittaforma corneae ATCC 50505]|uniref:DNA polymerase alpha/delta/epsilon subunit B domain-containing protein n=1 Tax=Vittaforma corneae (strain ATCC 50505) TaxID=993615 RepID=L2GM38_VITCO|nr:uncharacterized protein VICG_01090 [Vittaforma corneae ATCC 50505]ELA41906.1 hypothetical protein VICG_01090 [Vittaforma corneae ATCC 50505]